MIYTYWGSMQGFLILSSNEAVMGAVNGFDTVPSDCKAA